MLPVYRERIYHQASTGRKAPHHSMQLGLETVGTLVAEQSESEDHCCGSMCRLDVLECGPKRYEWDQIWAGAGAS